MKRDNRKIKQILFVIFTVTFILWQPLSAAALGSRQNPQSGSLGLQATIPSLPPSTAATITTPLNGQSFTSLPIVISGLCSGNLLIKAFSNNIFIGSSLCVNGSYSLKTDLFNGLNNLYVQDYDSLGQGGPLSNKVSVNFNGGQNATVGSQVTITSSYAEKGANPGQQLVWPVTISGGTPPYAISTDWGDGQAPKLQTASLSGSVNLTHIYSTAGTYTVTVTVSDSKGSTAFLQLVGVANGQVASYKQPKPNIANSNYTNRVTHSPVLLWALFGIIAALGPAFWLGVRHGRAVLLKKYK